MPIGGKAIVTVIHVLPGISFVVIVIHASHGCPGGGHSGHQHQQTDPCSVQAVQQITADYSKVPSITDLYRKQTKKPAYKPYLKISPDLLCTKNKPFTYRV